LRVAWDRQYLSPGVLSYWDQCSNFDIYVAFISGLSDIPAMPVMAITIAFLILNGLLWYVRPNGTLWLVGAIVLGVIWGAIFMRLITKEAGRKAG